MLNRFGLVVFGPDFFYGGAVVYEYSDFDLLPFGVGLSFDEGIGHGDEFHREGTDFTPRGVAGPDGVVVEGRVVAEEGLLEGFLDLVGGDVLGVGVGLPGDGAVDGVGFLAGGGCQ